VLVLLVQRLGDLHVGERLHALREPFGDRGLLPRHLLGAARLRHQLFLVADQLTDAALRHRERLDDVFLGDLERAALDHHDRVVRAGDDDLHVAVLELLERRIEHPIPLHASDPHAGDRIRERDAARVERVGRRDEGERVGVVLLVRRDHVAEDLDLVLEPLRKERTDRAVDDACAEDLVVGRTALALDEPAGNLAGCVRLLAILDRQREEGESALRVAHRDGREDHRVTEGDEA
jgi:hypothetical protein